LCTVWGGQRETDWSFGEFEVGVVRKTCANIRSCREPQKRFHNDRNERKSIPEHPKRRGERFNSRAGLWAERLGPDINREVESELISSGEGKKR